MNESPSLTPPVSTRDHSQGPANAPLTLVEYGDYQCPYCGAAYPVVKQLQEALGKKMRFVFRNFPLTQAHPYALIAAEAAEAAALEGKFWEMHDLLFERQRILEPGILPVWAREVGPGLRNHCQIAQWTGREGLPGERRAIEPGSGRHDDPPRHVQETPLAGCGAYFL